MNRDEIIAAVAALQGGVLPEGVVSLVHELPARPASLVEPPPGLAPEVLDYLAHVDIEKLYSHQAEACKLAISGKNVMLSTSTASGKTLAFTLPVLHELAVDPDACALFLYPLKALTNDQLEVFCQVEQMSGVEIAAAIYDGDSPRARRPRIREMSRVILSNPFEIHETLPYHHLWRRFFSNLRYVVIDEAHRYTGVFGSNVAQVIRRLVRVANIYGARPRFMLASASIANPAAHAAALTGVPCEVVERDGAPAGERTMVFVNGGAEGAGSAHTMTRNIVGALVGRGIKTLCFTRSRKTAELVAGLAAKASGGLPVAPYRAGYLPEERRRLERGFREGEIRGVVSTSALELGIDIGDLDSVVMSGYPGSVSGFWQQAGRAGRRGSASMAVFVAFEDILDQYLLKNPDILLGHAFERATVDLNNRHILAGHMLCAASELPLKIPETQKPHYGIAKGLAGSGLLRETAQGFIYGGAVRPQEAVKLDRIGDRTIALIDGATGDLLETIDFARALRDAHTGAVYLHQASTWLVEDLDLERLRAILVKRDVDYYTLSREERQVELEGQASSVPVGPGVEEWSAGLGQLKITHTITGFLMKRFDRVIGSVPLDLPPQVLQTTGFWIDFSTGVPEGITDMLGALHALEHTVVGIAPLVLSCDPDDLAGFSTMMAPHSGAPALFVYDGYEGGIGLAERAFSEMGRLLGVAADILARCPCESGCPACCLSPRCGNNNQPMDKRGAVVLAGMLSGRKSL